MSALVIAARKTNRQIEWVVYDGEGHGWSLARNRIDFWQRVERFLHKHIGADALTRTAAARPWAVTPRGAGSRAAGTPAAQASRSRPRHWPR